MYDKQVRRRRAVLGLLVAVSLILLTAFFGESIGGPLHSVQRGMMEVFSPIGEGANRALKPFRDLAGWFSDTIDAKSERDKLQKQVNQLRRQLIAAQGAGRENTQLRALVAFDHAGLSAFKPLTARVIYRSPSLFYATIEVDIGAGDGVALNDPVVNGQGLIGKVTSVTGDASQVTLITDHTSGISARINNSGITGLVQTALGNPNDLLVQYLPRGTKVNKGDNVVTAGSRSSRLESLFPPGIPIGSVTKSDPGEVNLYQRVHIRPFADLTRLDFVQVLTHPKTAPVGGQTAQLPVPAGQP